MIFVCEWLHTCLSTLPLVHYPFDLGQLPENAIYFFYEDGEVWGHGDIYPRIVRVGTHRDGNFRNRIAEHYLLDERRMMFDKTRSAPKDRSIFRKHIGRAILHCRHDAYAEMWEHDFMYASTREKYAFKFLIFCRWQHELFAIAFRN